MSIKNKLLALISIIGCFISGTDAGLNYPVIDYKTCFGLSGGKYSCLAVLETKSNLSSKVVQVLERPTSSENTFPTHLPSYIGKGSMRLCMTKPTGEVFILSFPESGAWPAYTFIDTDAHQTKFGMIYGHLLTMHDGKIGLFLGDGSHQTRSFQNAFKNASLGSLLNGANVVAYTSNDLTMLVPPRVECDVISKLGARADFIESIEELKLIAHLGYGVSPAIKDRLQEKGSDGLCSQSFGPYKIHFSVSTGTEAPPSIMIYNGAGQRVFTVSSRLALESALCTAQSALESSKADFAFYKDELLKNLPCNGNPCSSKEIEYLIEKLPRSILDLEVELKN